MVKKSPEGARVIAQRGADGREGEARSSDAQERGKRSALAQRSARRDTEYVDP